MTRFKDLPDNKGGCQDNKNNQIPEPVTMKGLYGVIAFKVNINICKRVD